MKLHKRYEEKIAAGEISPDPEQARAVEVLQALLNDFNPKKFSLFRTKKQLGGIYMYGGVGRGKSMLMDWFFDALPQDIRARRVHFHEFMIETHDWMHTRRGDRVDDLIPRYAADVADKTRVLCFDEFHVVDVADAMILSRLFTALLDKNVVIVSTSNWPPDRLYEGGLQRELFLPFIDLLKKKLQIVHLDHDTDYRTQSDMNGEVYFYPLGPVAREKADVLFNRMTAGTPPVTQTVTVKGRNIPVLSANGIARCRFSDLCEQPHAAEDYLAIAGQFHTLFLEGVPKMGYDRRNEIKRLILLIDVFYDRKGKLVVTADAPPEKLYYGQEHAFEFDRTISRLREMQSSSWAANTVE